MLAATPNPPGGEVRLDGAGGFDAYLLNQGDAGIWTVESISFFPGHGCREVVALDDKGRCTILSNYSGKWTPWTVVHDGRWLGGIAHGDVDPRVPGAELYVGGQSGNLYQIRPHAQGGFDSRVIAYLPGREIHTLVAADLDDARAGLELFVFTSPGGWYRVEPDGEAELPFRCMIVSELPGRVRDAVVLARPGKSGSRLVTVSRAGDLSELTFDDGSPSWRKLYQTDMGLGRIAARTDLVSSLTVLYVTADDGRVIRLHEREDGGFDPEVIYNGPQGPRGIVAGRFHADPDREAVAVFGYSREVVLLTRESTAWVSQTIFADIDRGHWLATGEFDGRNATDEIILSGYGSRVVMLARPPAFGLDPAPSTAP